MSYILDALKKAEQKRRQGAVPDLLTVHERPADNTRKIAWWPYISLTVLLLGSGVILAFFYKAHPGMSGNDRIQAAIPQPAQIVPQAPEPVTSRPAQPVQTEKVPAVQAPTREAGTRKVDDAAPHSDTQMPETRPSPKPVLLKENELPPGIQQELPRIVVSAHLYDANPAARIVSINGNIVHEGQDVAAGFRLEKITQDGVVLNYKGYRFFRPVF